MTQDTQAGVTPAFPTARRTAYASLSREELEDRLEAAEALCILYSWTGVRRETDREVAAFELWRKWFAIVGEEFLLGKAHPDLQDRALRPLVERGRRIRERTLRQIQEHAVLPADEFTQ